MENRITNLLLPIIVVVLGFFLLQNFFLPKKDKEAQKEERTTKQVIFDGDAAKDLAHIVQKGEQKLYRHTVGELGQPGFKLVFSPEGGSLMSARLLDVYVKAGLDEEQKREDKNLYPIIDPFPDADGAVDISFSQKVLQGRNLVYDESAHRAVQLKNALWERVVEGGIPEEEGVRYRLTLSNGLIWEKDYLFQKGSREIQLRIRLRNTKGIDYDYKYFKYDLYGAEGLPNMKVDRTGMLPPSAFAAIKSDGEIDSPVALQPDGKPQDRVQKLLDVSGQDSLAYAGSSTRFFTCILQPTKSSAKAVETVSMMKLPDEDSGETKAYSTATPVLTIRHPFPRAVEGKKETQTELSFDIYLGPKERSYFAGKPELEPYVAVLNNDLQSPCFCTPPGVTLFAKALLKLLSLFHGLLGNWGLSIVLLTILVRSAMLPLNLKQQKSMRIFQAKSARLKPQMDAIKEKYKKNKEKMNKAVMEFQKENKLFPPLMGCLPLFLTMPIFFGLFTMLRASYELRQQPAFSFIQDLSQPDHAVYLGLKHLPFLGDGLEYLNILPLVMMALWVVSAFSAALPEDPQQRSMQKMMRFMPLLFGVMLYTYASGLALYMCVSALWTVIEQRIIKAKYGTIAAGTSPM